MQEQVTELANKAYANATQKGTDLCAHMAAAAKQQLLWTRYLISNQATGTASSLLAGSESAVREAAACLVLGLARPAINSLRQQIDLAMSWLYFKDHPIEWRVIQETGENFKLKKELMTYLKDWYPRFSGRWGILLEVKRRTVPDPYRLLSAHMHGQNETSIPTANSPSDVVADDRSQSELVMLQGECSEFITDLFWALYADHWRALPSDLYDAVIARFATDNQRAEFFRR